MDFNHFIKKYQYDILRFNEHFDNWINSKTKYPILFIKYDTLERNLDFIQKKYPNLNINNYIKKKFRKRQCNLDNLTLDQIEKLEKIYGNLRRRILYMPDYWVKYP